MTTDRLRTQIGILNAAIGRAFSTDKDWNVQLIGKLADWLALQGITNVLQLSHFQDKGAGVAFFYNRDTGQVLDRQLAGFATGQWIDNPGYASNDTLTVFTQDGRFNVFVNVRFSQDGYPYFYTLTQDTGSDWVDIRGGVIFVASVVVTAGFASLGSAIGNAMFAGTAVPASVSTAIGNVIVTTALNGGDVQAAAIGAVTGGVGGVAGGVVTSATGAQWIGQAAAAATAALARGGDVTTAVSQSLLMSGVRNMSDIFDWMGSTPVVDDMTPIDPTGNNQVQYTFGGDVSTGYGNTGYYTDSNGISYGYDASGNLVVVDVDSNGVGFYEDSDGYPAVADAGQPITAGDSISAAQLPAPAGSSQAGNTNYAGIIMAGLQLVKAYQQSQMPVRTYTASTQAGANGYVNAVVNGKVVSGKPAVGVPYQTATGAIITNNGDGTYSTVNPLTGNVTTSRYAAASSGLAGIDSKTLLIGGAAVLGVLLLSQRR